MATGDKLKILLEKVIGIYKFRVKLSPDRLKLYLDVERSSNAEQVVDRAVLLAVLKEVIKTERLKETAVEAAITALNRGQILNERIIAQGRAPAAGLDGRVQLIIKPTAKGSKASDTRYIRDLQNVVPGMLLAKIHPPTKGTDGEDVFAEALKAQPGKSARILCDRSIVQTAAAGDDGSEYLKARSSGFFLLDRDRYVVAKTLEIDGDVDIGSGNIEFIGPVSVKNDVAKGFGIKAGGDIEVAGSVLGGSLESIIASVAVRGHLLGGRGYTVKAGKMIAAEMMQDVSGYAEGDILITKDAKDCTLKNWGAVRMPKGHLLAGSTQCLLGLEADIIGSAGESNTRIRGYSERELDLALSAAATELEKLRDTEKVLAIKGEPLLAAEAKVPLFSAGEIIQINKVIFTLYHTRQAIEILERRVARINAVRPKLVFRVNFLNTLHKGVSIAVGEDTFTAEADISGPGTIEYRPAERSFQKRSLAALCVMPKLEQSAATPDAS